MSTLRTIDASTACRLLAEDRAILLDVREPDEHARERIPQATSLPLARLERTPPVEAGGKLVILHCRSGARSALAARELRDAGIDARSLSGGIERWTSEVEADGASGGSASR